MVYETDPCLTPKSATRDPFETQDDALTDTPRLIETTQPTFEIEHELRTVDPSGPDNFIENVPETENPITLRPPSNNPVENPRPKRISKPPCWLGDFKKETTE